MMEDLLAQPEVFRHWFGEFISQSRHELDLAIPEPLYENAEIHDLLQQGEQLHRLNGIRALRVGDSCFVNGELMDTHHIEAADALCQYDCIDKQHLGDALADPKFIRLLTHLVNQGYWYFED